MRTAIICCVVTLTVVGVATADDAPLFPFVVSYDAPDNVTNVSRWIERPAGRHGFVRVEDGRTVNDAGPIRFWATNLCFDACFPDHDQAERVAARMARLGINCVRMHHMDNRSIWGNSPNKTIIDPERLERLDYLIHQLKLHGIYTNINLHVSRTLGEREGFSDAALRPNYDKGLDNFEPRMIELQRKYARDLLTHVNPYTRTKYVDEPAVAFIEINNENALFNTWNGGDLDTLPDPYSSTFRSLWNAWLKDKYSDTAGLRKAWKMGEFPLGEEMLAAGRFSAESLGGWNLERDSETEAEWSVEPFDTNDGDGEFLRIEVTRNGQVAWHPQLTLGGLAVEKDKPYTLACRLRSDAARRISVNVMMAHEPWERLGLDAGANVTTEWQDFHWTFPADRDDANARISFSSFQPGVYELADVSLRPGGILGLDRSAKLEDDSVPVLERGDLNLTAAARHDFVDFLWDTEQAYWGGMYAYIKEELGARPLVSGTQLTYSPVHVQAELDYIDAHAYWNHPVFPNRSWDSRDWYVRNLALVNSRDGGTLPGLAARRVQGMAYTVSEYNHPAPNQYAAEGFPMLAAFGAFQSWDGIFPFTYSHNADFEPGRITSYFDVKGDTAKLVHMPACAAMFLRADVAPAEQTVLVALSGDQERRTLHDTLTPRSLTAVKQGMDPRVSLTRGVGLDLQGRTTAAPEIDDRQTEFISDTGQLRWNTEREGAGYFLVDSPCVKLFTGFVGGRTFELGDVTLEIGSTRLDWATISMVAVDARDGADTLGSPGRILIAATGLTQNTDAELEELGGDRITLANRWGSAPVLCEGIPATILLPTPAERVRCYPLDESGNRRAAVPVEVRGGKAAITLRGEYRTVWYEVEVR